jgi:hypothetical protein
VTLTPTHVYWFGDRIYRAPKSGGPPEKVVDMDRSAGGVQIAPPLLYLWSFPTISRVPLDGGVPEPLVTNASEGLSWIAVGSQLYYFSNPSRSGQGGAAGMQQFTLELRSVPSAGGPSLLLADEQWAGYGLAADATGIYWYHDPLYADPLGASGASALEHIGELRKYTFATGAVSVLMQTRTIVSELVVASGRMVWVDGDDVWSATTDGADPILLWQGPLIRSLATDGRNAFWGTSATAEANSDILGTPLTGGSLQRLACNIESFSNGLAADQSALYYSPWTHDLIGKIPNTMGSGAL